MIRISELVKSELLTQDKRLLGDGFKIRARYDSKSGVIHITVIFEQDYLDKVKLIKRKDIDKLLRISFGGGYQVTRFRTTRVGLIMFLDSYDTSQKTVESFCIDLKNHLQTAINKDKRTR